MVRRSPFAYHQTRAGFKCGAAIPPEAYRIAFNTPPLAITGTAAIIVAADDFRCGVPDATAERMETANG